MSTLYYLNPCLDGRWSRFIEGRADASVFHSVGWLQALQGTYGYEPVAYTTSPEGVELRDGAAFCHISTWLSARRLVSIPFSDHAAILSDDNTFMQDLCALLNKQVQKGFYRYVEVRPPAPLNIHPSLLGKTDRYCWHRLCLNQNIERIYGSFHKDCIQRKIRRGEREKLAYAEGRSEELVQQFYQLLLMTHRRHGIPPQPIKWFHNLVRFLGDAVKFRIAFKDTLPIASIMTLTYNKSMIYKYGCSDASHHNLGGMAFLFWHAIREAKEAGLRELDLGRSDFENSGLLNFKEHLGATRSCLEYWGFPAGIRPNPKRWHLKAVRALFERMPTAALPMAGNILYRHMG